MADVTSRTLHEAKMQIDCSNARVTRDDRRVRIKFEWAGRFTKDDISLDVDDIKRLADFVEATNGR